MNLAISPMCMKPSRRRKRIVVQEWAESLRGHINSQQRGYQAQMSRDTGCSEAMINRIKTASIDVSEWVEVLARYCDLPIPPLGVDEAQNEMLALSEKISDAHIQTVLRLMRDLAGEPPT